MLSESTSTTTSATAWFRHSDWPENKISDFFEKGHKKSAFRTSAAGRFFIYWHMLLLLDIFGESGVLGTDGNFMLRFVGERAACYNKNNDINRSFGVQDLKIYKMRF